MIQTIAALYDLESVQGFKGSEVHGFGFRGSGGHGFGFRVSGGHGFGFSRSTVLEVQPFEAEPLNL
jgi:hypothetical protein